jgi:hypothetical protein
MKKRGNRSLSLRFYYEFSQQEGLTVLSKPAKKTGDHPFPRSPAIKHYQTTKPNPNTTSKPSQLNKASHLEVTRNSREERPEARAPQSLAWPQTKKARMMSRLSVSQPASDRLTAGRRNKARFFFSSPFP